MSSKQWALSCFKWAPWNKKQKMEWKMRNIFWQWQIKGKQFIIRWDEEEEECKKFVIDIQEKNKNSSLPRRKKN